MTSGYHSEWFTVRMYCSSCGCNMRKLQIHLLQRQKIQMIQNSSPQHFSPPSKTCRVQVSCMEMKLLLVAPDHFKMLLSLNKPPATRWRASVRQPPASHEPLVCCWPPLMNVGEITRVGSDLDSQVMGSTHN